MADAAYRGKPCTQKPHKSLKAKQGVAPEPPVAKMITTTTTMAATTLRAGQGVTASSPRRL